VITMLFAMVGRPADEELVLRFNNGDREAFSELVRRYQHRVYGMCLRWMGDRQIAAEVAQDVFLALFKALSGFRGDARLSTWIYRVTVNHCKNRDLYRRRRGHGRHESVDGLVDDEDAPAKQFASDGPDTDAHTRQMEARDALQAGLDALDEEQRRIIVLRDIEDLSYEEIANILDLPKGTVKSRLHRARHELARRLGRRLSMADVV